MKRNSLYGIFHWLSPHLFLLDVQSQSELPDHHNSLVIRLVYVISKNREQLYFFTLEHEFFLKGWDVKERSH